ncbi:hypothetical protein [Oceanirhabdus sp. W0125-5]|uniref:hypothetical protein n=1 Tax=Oceanirhabdus sp. W0125-5 TaxID=2999116 RepID=UPI0022F2CED2|nr:hypothetical protein [Oceanirhabdus sp. W0125-5]WBW98063.1 hypothetical protein OW730_04675 [Oceanirhabdus sp. W0125-5]
MRFVDKLERKFGRYAIKNLVTKLAYIYSAVYIALFVFAFVEPRAYYAINNFMYFDINLVLRGQIWRIFTFIFMPSFRPDIITTLFLFFIVRFMMYIGNTLEYYWGTFKLNLYYLIGIVSVLVISSITNTPIADSGPLHLSIFLACAFIAGDTTLHLYGILPVKMKYLAYLDLLFIAFAVLTQPIGGKLVALAPLVPYFLFFWKDIYYLLMNKKRYHDYRKNRGSKTFTANYEKPKVMHKCEICGVTDVSDPNMEFRYCSKCEGLHEYCIEHINNHEHVK